MFAVNMNILNSNSSKCLSSWLLLSLESTRGKESTLENKVDEIEGHTFEN